MLHGSPAREELPVEKVHQKFHEARAGKTRSKLAVIKLINFYKIICNPIFINTSYKVRG